MNLPKSDCIKRKKCKVTRRKELFYYVTSGSNVMRDAHSCVTVFYQQIENGNIANQIHGFTIDYGKFILRRYEKHRYRTASQRLLWVRIPLKFSSLNFFFQVLISQLLKSCVIKLPCSMMSKCISFNRPHSHNQRLTNIFTWVCIKMIY